MAKKYLPLVIIFLQLVTLPLTIVSRKWGVQKPLDFYISRVKGKNLNVKYFVYNHSKKINHDLFRASRHISNKQKFGIVVQGPIHINQNFTYETIHFYLNNFLDVEVVLSTWEKENIDLFRPLKDLYSNFTIVQQAKPQDAGVGNINFQICSTRAGLEVLEKKNVNLALKIRTDQGVFDELALVKLSSSLSSIEESKKIVFVSAGTFLLRLYGPSDFLQFGELKRLIEYWSVSYEVKESKREYVFDNTSSLRDFSKSELCEVYLGASYLRLKGENLKFTLKDSLEMYEKYFLIVGQDEIGFFWNKYTFQANKWGVSEFPNPYIELSETLRSAIFASDERLEDFEFLLDMPFDGKSFL